MTNIIIVILLGPIVMILQLLPQPLMYDVNWGRDSIQAVLGTLQHGLHSAQATTTVQYLSLSPSVSLTVTPSSQPTLNNEITHRRDRMTDSLVGDAL